MLLIIEDTGPLHPVKINPNYFAKNNFIGSKNNKLNIVLVRLKYIYLIFLNHFSHIILFLTLKCPKH